MKGCRTRCRCSSEYPPRRRKPSFQQRAFAGACSPSGACAEVNEQRSCQSLNAALTAQPGKQEAHISLAAVLAEQPILDSELISAQFLGFQRECSSSRRKLSLKQTSAGDLTGVPRCRQETVRGNEVDPHSGNPVRRTVVVVHLYHTAAQRKSLLQKRRECATRKTGRLQ